MLFSIEERSIGPVANKAGSVRSSYTCIVRQTLRNVFFTDSGRSKIYYSCQFSEEIKTLLLLLQKNKLFWRCRNGRRPGATTSVEIGAESVIQSDLPHACVLTNFAHKVQRATKVPFMPIPLFTCGAEFACLSWLCEKHKHTRKLKKTNE